MASNIQRSVTFHRKWFTCKRLHSNYSHFSAFILTTQVNFLLKLLNLEAKDPPNRLRHSQFTQVKSINHGRSGTNYGRLLPVFFIHSTRNNTATVVTVCLHNVKVRHTRINFNSWQSIPRLTKRVLLDYASPKTTILNRLKPTDSRATSTTIRSVCRGHTD